MAVVDLFLPEEDWLESRSQGVLLRGDADASGLFRDQLIRAMQPPPWIHRALPAIQRCLPVKPYPTPVFHHGEVREQNGFAPLLLKFGVRDERRKVGTKRFARRIASPPCCSSAGRGSRAFWRRSYFAKKSRGDGYPSRSEEQD